MSKKHQINDRYISVYHCTFLHVCRGRFKKCIELLLDLFTLLCLLQSWALFNFRTLSYILIITWLSVIIWT